MGQSGPVQEKKSAFREINPFVYRKMGQHTAQQPNHATKANQGGQAGPANPQGPDLQPDITEQELFDILDAHYHEIQRQRNVPFNRDINPNDPQDGFFTTRNNYRDWLRVNKMIV